MSETTIILQNCLARLRAGDEDARGELIAHASRRLKHLTRRMFGGYSRLEPFEDEDDVYQEAMLRLNRALLSIQPESVPAFLALAAKQIRRELCDLSKHYFGPHGDGKNQQVWPNNSNSGELQFDPRETDSCSPERLAFWTEFHQAVERLPFREREAFELLWYHELTQFEAAEMAGLSERQVRRNWLSARLKLTKALRGILPDNKLPQ